MIRIKYGLLPESPHDLPVLLRTSFLQARADSLKVTMITPINQNASPLFAGISRYILFNKGQLDPLVQGITRQIKNKTLSTIKSLF